MKVLAVVFTLMLYTLPMAKGQSISVGSTPDTTATHGVSYSYQVAASSSVPGTISYFAPSLPPWCTFSNLGGIVHTIVGDGNGVSSSSGASPLQTSIWSPRSLCLLYTSDAADD